MLCLKVYPSAFQGRTLRCSLSEVKHRLFISNVPRYLTEDDVREILEDCGPGIEHIQLPKVSFYLSKLEEWKSI